MQELALRNRTLSVSRNRALSLILPLILVLLLLTQTVSARNTYVITDGDRTLVHMTYATDPDAVLGEAGLTLGAEDTYVTAQEAGISNIYVTRAAATSAVTATRLEVYTEAIPHNITYCEASWLDEGEEQVLTVGSDGQMRCTASVSYQEGVETGRTILDRTVTVHPVDEVIARGTGTAAAPTEGTPVIEGGTITTPTGEVLTYSQAITVLATAYSLDGWPESDGITATGTQARYGEIAVDPEVIPLGTRMYIVSEDGQVVYGIATAEDTGSLILGHRIDLYYDTYDECVQFGARNCIVYILD